MAEKLQRKHHCTLCLEQEVFEFYIATSKRRFFIPDPASLLTYEVLKSQFSIQAERKRHYYFHPWTISPLSSVRFWWETVIAVALFVFFSFEPANVSFVFDDDEENTETWFRTLELTLVGFFAADMIMNFLTGFVNYKTMEIELSFLTIAVTYFKFYFWIDLISTIPFYIIISTFDDVSTVAMFYMNYFTSIFFALISLKYQRTTALWKKLSTSLA